MGAHWLCENIVKGGCLKIKSCKTFSFFFNIYSIQGIYGINCSLILKVTYADLIILSDTQIDMLIWARYAKQYGAIPRIQNFKLYVSSIWKWGVAAGLRNNAYHCFRKYYG